MPKQQPISAKISSTKLTLLIAGGAIVFTMALFAFFKRTSPDMVYAPAASGTAVSPVSAPISLGSPTPQKRISLILAASPEARVAVQILQEIIKSRNDNDQRLDTQLKHLTIATREAFREQYRNLPLEDRNGRGTIVFLLGRNIENPEDVAFMNEVLNEKPCLSLENCGKAIPSGAGADLHLEAGASVTMSYPQLVGLNALAATVSQTSGAKPALRDAARKAIQDAKSSENPMVAKKAHDLKGSNN